MKVYEIANFYKISSISLVDLIGSWGFSVRSHMVSLDHLIIDLIHDLYGHNSTTNYYSLESNKIEWKIADRFSFSNYLVSQYEIKKIKEIKNEL